MIKLDDNLLQELGLGLLSGDDKKKMLAHIYETLEMRVGMELAKQMTDAQLREFEEFITRGDEAGALRWLETNFPNYKNVVAAEFEKLKQEIKQVAPQILASSQQQQQQSHPQPVQQQSTGQPYQQQPYAPHPQYAQPPAPHPQQPYYAQYPGQTGPGQSPYQAPYPAHNGGQPPVPPSVPPANYGSPQQPPTAPSY